MSESLAEYLKRSVDPSNPRLSIKPRNYTSEADKPLIVVTGSTVYVERVNETYDKSFLPQILKDEPSSFLVTHSSGELCRWLHGFFSDDPLWQFRATPLEKEVITRKGKKVVIQDCIVHFLGFQRSNGHSTSKYHYPLDPGVISRSTANRLYPQTSSTLEALRCFGTAIRTFLVENQMKISASSGGIAAQLLKDKRFYPDMRRKVPRATNEKARVHLPGNFYRIYSKGRQFKSAYYLDQSSAHHRIASEINLPSADGLYARGHFFDESPNNIWARKGTRRYTRELARHGLLKLRVTVPPKTSLTFAPPYLDRSGDHVIFCYTNEIEFIQSLGVIIEGIVAAWTSNEIDMGIRKLANWSLNQAKLLPSEDKSTIKPIALSTYGVLASKPRILKFAFAKTKKGEIQDVTMGGLPIKASVTETTRKGGDTLSNVIQRGMIEAETRNRSLQLAKQLQDYNKAEIIMVYADSILVNMDQLPFLPDTWRVQAHLTLLRIINEVSFTSQEMTKLPGIPFQDEREVYDRMQRISPARRIKKLDLTSEGKCDRIAG